LVQTTDGEWITRPSLTAEGLTALAEAVRELDQELRNVGQRR
jgi:hypothetical protein